MNATRVGNALYELCGVIRELDPVGRQLTVDVDGSPREVDVAPDCKVLLNGERVKLRLLQPTDHARLVCTQSAGGLVAYEIRVNWWSAFAASGPTRRAQVAGGLVRRAEGLPAAGESAG